MKKFAIVTALLTLSACAHESPRPSTPAAYVGGSYTGTITDALAGEGHIELVFKQDDTVLSGNFQTMFKNPAFNKSDSVDGGADVSGSVIDLYEPLAADDDRSKCAFVIRASVRGNVMRGLYHAEDCPFTDHGLFTATRVAS